MSSVINIVSPSTELSIKNNQISDICIYNLNWWIEDRKGLNQIGSLQ